MRVSQFRHFGIYLFVVVKVETSVNKRGAFIAKIKPSTKALREELIECIRKISQLVFQSNRFGTTDLKISGILSRLSEVIHLVSP